MALVSSKFTVIFTVLPHLPKRYCQGPRDVSEGKPEAGLKKMQKRRILLFLVVFIVILSTATVGLGGMKRGTLKDVSPEEAYELIQKRNGSPDFIILDVRTPEEYKEGYIENALNINFYSDEFNSELRKLDKDKAYLIYCRSGGRSGRTLNMMKQLGFKEVYNIQGGMVKWLYRENPVVK